jgi:hypothetical protein
MKHVLYVFYVIFYASAVFLAGLFAGQLVERRNARPNSRSFDPKTVKGGGASRKKSEPLK